MFEHIDIVGTIWEILFFQWVLISNLVGVCPALRGSFSICQAICDVIAGPRCSTHQYEFSTGICDILPPVLSTILDCFCFVTQYTGTICYNQRSEERRVGNEWS